MVGYGNNRGIIPIVCEELFNRCKASTAGCEYRVQVSMLEIYNEAVSPREKLASQCGQC